MTSRDFRAIASVLADNGADGDLVWAFAEFLALTNPRFDRSRFLAAARGHALPGDNPRERDYRHVK